MSGPLQIGTEVVQRIITVAAGSRPLHLELRRLASMEDYRRAEDLQTRVWGLGDVVWVPSLVLITAQENGGLVVGAFDGPRLVGFVCSYPGITDDGRIKQTSQLLAVDPDYQHSGIGFHLKLMQRQITLQQDLDLVTWTFDPLLSVNAQLNLGKLGCIASRYLVNIYGMAETGLNAGLPTDRLLVEWWLREAWVEDRLAGLEMPLPVEVPCVNEVVLRPGSGLPENRSCALELRDPVLLMEIPQDLGALKKEEMSLARAWRFETRELFQRYLGCGYQVRGFQRVVRDGRARCCYVLRREPLHGST